MEVRDHEDALRAQEEGEVPRRLHARPHLHAIHRCLQSREDKIRLRKKECNRCGSLYPRGTIRWGVEAEQAPPHRLRSPERSSWRAWSSACSSPRPSAGSRTSGSGWRTTTASSRRSSSTCCSPKASNRLGGPSLRTWSCLAIRRRSRRTSRRSSRSDGNEKGGAPRHPQDRLELERKRVRTLCCRS